LASKRDSLLGSSRPDQRVSEKVFLGTPTSRTLTFETAMAVSEGKRSTI
jgi:hypothetical protein|tara:strand:- start:174 stop:320 length:147 start_codon:yes stop_codon:yes gene_type:complete